MASIGKLLVMILVLGITLGTISIMSGSSMLPDYMVDYESYIFWGLAVFDLFLLIGFVYR